MALDALDFRLVNDWQRGFPLTAQPYAVLGHELGLAEAEVIGRLGRLVDAGAISRVGAVFRPHVLGHSTLAALACPADRLESVAALVSACPEVNHNYEREHPYNLWFVVTAPSAERVAGVLAEVHRASGLKPLDLPMLTDYHIDLGFDLRRRGPHRHPAGSANETATIRAALTSADYALAAALESGLPLAPRPYAQVGAACGMDEAAVLAGLARLLLLGAMRRLGVVVRHRELGFGANAMVVWDVPDARVDAVGRMLSGQDAVTLCYRRPRRLPDWPYNLFSMLHGQDRDTVLAELERMRAELGLDDIPCRPLFSRRRFKQCGARYAGYARAA
jgi:DNA-binding Lrp family transcriptional regulator